MIKKQKSPGGATLIVFGEEEKALILEHCATLNLTQTADLLGLGTETLAKIFKRQPEVASWYRSSKLKKVLAVVAALETLAIDEGNIQAISLFLKTQHPTFRPDQIVEEDAEEVVTLRFNGTLPGDNSHLRASRDWQLKNLGYSVYTENEVKDDHEQEQEH